MWGASTSSSTTAVGTENDVEITCPPYSAVTAMEFSPFQTVRKNLLLASCLDQTVHLWEVRRSHQTVLKTKIAMPAITLDVAWSVDGKIIFMGSSDNKFKHLDLEKPKLMVGVKESHNGPIKTCNIIKESFYKDCVMTGSLDKTVKIWDIRCNEPVVSISFPDKIACADVDDTMAVVCTEQGSAYVYELGATIQLVRNFVPPFQSERRCVAIFRDRMTEKPAGFAMGTLEGRVFSIYNRNLNYAAILLNSQESDNLMTTSLENTGAAVNDIKYHPVHRTLAVARKNGHYSFYNMEPTPTMLYDKLRQSSIVKCCFNRNGTIFAYHTGYDRTKTIPLPSIYLNYGCLNDNDPAVSTT